MASDGKNAIKLAVSTEFDAILLDIVMPSLGGLQTATHLKSFMASGCIAPTPLIALTAYDTPYDVDRCNRAQHGIGVCQRMGNRVDPAVVVAPLPDHGIGITDRPHLAGLEKILKNAEEVAPPSLGACYLE